MKAMLVSHMSQRVFNFMIVFKKRGNEEVIELQFRF